MTTDANATMLLRHFSAISKVFDPALFEPVRNSYDPTIQKGFCVNSKCRGGLWTSPVGSSHSWGDYLLARAFDGCKYYFDLEFCGRAFVVDSVEDMNRLPWASYAFADILGQVDFETLAKEFDAVHLTVKGQEETAIGINRSLWGWDCETVLILNPNSVRAIYEPRTTRQ